MKVGIFHPTINACGGAEWVAVKMINSLSKANHETIVLTNQKVNQGKIKKIFGEEAHINREIVFHLEPFNQTDLHNVYTDGIRTLFLKSQCDVLVDTESNALLPGVNITYIHFPLLGRLDDYKKSKLKATRARLLYFEPYRIYERRESQNCKRIVFSNSMYTGNAMKTFGMSPTLLYPPISNLYYLKSDETCNRNDVVVTVARIDPWKRLSEIPTIAKFTNNKIRFLIIGLKQSQQELNNILNEIDRNRVSDRVEVMTNLSQEKLQNILCTSKVYLHMSRNEHFGVSLAQAMASGCIPIAYDAGGPREFVPEKYRFRELEEAARKIEKTIFEWAPQESRRISQMARLFSEDTFSSNFLNSLNVFLARS